MIFHSHENNPVSNSLTLSLVSLSAKRHHSRARLISLPLSRWKLRQPSWLGKNENQRKWKSFANFLFWINFFFMKVEVRDNIQIHVWQDLEKKLNWIFASRQMPQYAVECAENFHEATDVSRTLAARKSIAERCDVFWKWTLKKHSERCARTRLFLASGKSKQFCFRQFSRRNYFDDMNRV